jgi:hypothetical protein
MKLYQNIELYGARKNRVQFEVQIINYFVAQFLRKILSSFLSDGIIL